MKAIILMFANIIPLIYITIMTFFLFLGSVLLESLDLFIILCLIVGVVSNIILLLNMYYIFIKGE